MTTHITTQINENISISMEEEDLSVPLVFTRYLYSKEEVLHSLFISILDKNYEEALFWGYELYYSGYQNDTMEYLMRIYNELFSSVNTKSFDIFIKDKNEKWISNREQDWLFGTIIWNLCIRPYDISNFVETYFNTKIQKKNKLIDNIKKVNIRVNMTDKDIEKYKTKTVETTKVLPHYILKNASLYPTRKEVNKLFNTTDIDITTQYREHWLYYASFSPLWENRINEYNGIRNDETKKIIFDNEDNEEKFYDLYGYDIEEQPLHIQQKSIGNCNDKQLSIEEFIEKYT